MDEELYEAGHALLKAGHEYFNQMRKRNLAGGCIWLTGKDGAMVIFTRGEYRAKLLDNIEMNMDAKRAVSFGVAELPDNEST